MVAASAEADEDAAAADEEDDAGPGIALAAVFTGDEEIGAGTNEDDDEGPAGSEEGLDRTRSALR